MKKVNMLELREMIASAVRQTMQEAKKKVIPQQSEETIEATREKKTRGLPGYTTSKTLDMSKPLGKRNRYKRQGAANMGNWTSESKINENALDDEETQTGDFSGIGRQAGQKLSAMVGTLVDNGVPSQKAIQIAKQLIAKMQHGFVDDPAENGLDDPKELGLEAKHEAIRRLVRLIVSEEIKLTR